MRCSSRFSTVYRLIDFIIIFNFLAQLALFRRVLLFINVERILLEDGNVKDEVKLAKKWRGTSMTGRITPFIYHIPVGFNVSVLMLNLRVEETLRRSQKNWTSTSFVCTKSSLISCGAASGHAGHAGHEQLFLPKI